MIKKILLLSFALSSLLLSCRKDSKSNYLEITVDGKTYREERPIGLGYGNYAGDFCDPRPNVGWNIMEIDLSSLYFSADMASYEEYTDFQQSVPGSYNINDGIFFINPCNSNLDIVLTFNDNTLPDDTKLTLQPSGRVHTVTGIKQHSQSDNDVEYIVTGTFSCTFKNVVDKIYSVSGSYQTSFFVIK
jgi:hypothetical protein